MWTLRLTLLLAIAFGCRGQEEAYFDIGVQIQMDTTQILGTTSTDRRLCFDGTNTYYTDGTQIFMVGDTASVIDTGGPTIYSISCHCNIIVYSYVIDGTPDSAVVIYYDTRDSGISIMLDIDDTNPVAVELSPSHGLVVVGFTRIWIYDKAPLSQTVKSYIYLDEDSDNRLANLPRCVATYDTTGSNDLIVFVSYATNNNVQAITIPSATPSTGSSTVSVTNREVRLSNFGARVACVDVDQDSDFIYFLVVHDSQANIWELQRYNIGDWESGSVDDSMATSLASGTNGAVGSNVNGLVVCGSACPATCGQTTCSCPTTAPLCGFCIDDSTICQCENPAQEGCIYEDATLEANCFVPDPHFDSYCIVELPLAQRRKGDPIRVFGAAAASATMSVSRLAQTGRWNTDTLPINTAFTGSNAAVYWNGFEAAVPSSGRGRRFGVYEADITPTDVSINGESIPCIATENSGFYNQYYTYTRSIGQSVTLVATMASNLLQFVDDVRWYFTGFSTTTGLPLSSTPVSGCHGQLTCTLNSLAETHQGVYEAYRIRRGKRTWHPIFYLFVRGCADGSFGTTCSGTCPTCVHGECDDISGLCTCQAGWSGTDCDTVCGAGEVGQACGILCSDIIAARADCSGLSFCVPGKVGCHCYSGLEAPDCMSACGAGTCGPSCDSACDGGAATCDARTCV